MTSTAAPSVRPCIHPRCRDQDDNPRLTTQTMCDPCRRHYRKQLDWIVIDYVRLKAYMPSPIRVGDHHGGPRNEPYGHPAEWASDTCRDIAGMLNDGERKLRTSLDHGKAPAPASAETTMVESAYRYLADHFHDLCEFPDADAICEAIGDTHATIRRALGHTRFLQRLPVPCPTCDIAALVRSVGQIDCGSCGRTIREEDYPMFTRIAIDYLIDAYDTQRQAELDTAPLHSVN